VHAVASGSKSVSRNPSALALNADLCAPAVRQRYQAAMCRGVLNDMITDAERDAALRGLRGALSDGGLLMLDVRESEGSRRLADRVPRHWTADLGLAVSWSSAASRGRPAFCTSLRTARCARSVRSPIIAGATSSCGRGARGRSANA
jgi:hypothetical protein